VKRDRTGHAIVGFFGRSTLLRSEPWNARGQGTIDLETVRTTIDAYGKGLIELPPIREKAREVVIKYVDDERHLHPYTILSVAEFLGWSVPDKSRRLALKVST
jgi:hypothetical protein